MELVLQELEKAAKRGIRIRLLVSQSLINEDPETLTRFRKMPGALVRVYDLSKLTGGVQHAKYWIIDGKETFMGSQNFDWRSLTHIQELGVRIQDSELAHQLTQVFELDWKVAKTERLPDFLMAPVLSESALSQKKIELVASPPELNPTDVRPALQALLSLIHSAKKTLKIQLLDYSPISGNQSYWPEIDNALRAALVRGVKIQILLGNSASNDRSMDYLKSLATLKNMEIKKVTIPPYSGGAIPFARLIHSKYMVVDDEVLWIGTSNWSRGYFYNSRNIELILRKPELAQTANLIFQKLWDFSHSEKIKPNP